jgi:hypothetical protein
VSLIRSFARRSLAVASSTRTAVVLLLLLFLLTWLGTLYQVDHGLHAAQKMYFDSWYLFQPLWGRLSIPLPGGMLAMLLLFVNLLLGGIIRLCWSAARAGILIGHLGIALMLLAGFVKFYFANEGYLKLDEGESASMYADYYRWEVVISRRQDDGTVREYLIPEEFFKHLGPEDWRRFEHPELPVAIELARFLPNSLPLPKGPMFVAATPVVDGYFLRPEAWNREAESNAAGLYARVAGDPAQQGLLWGRDVAPWTVTAGDQRLGVSLRNRLYPLPYSIRLEDFHHEFHPGTQMARVYRSDVTILGESQHTQRIEMNEPLRRDGVIMFQASYGPPNARPGQRMYSVFAVVQNPSDQWPLYSCIVIGIGLVWHFSRKLLLYIRRTRREVTV